MNATKLQHDWDNFLVDYTHMNLGRPTRLGFFEPSSGAASDYWIECGVPFGGINVSAAGNAATIRITVGPLTHEVRNVIKLSSQLTATGDEDGLDILDADGRVTVLRFERAGIPG